MLSRLPLVAGLLACLALTAQAAEAADRRFYPADVPQHSEYRAPAYRPYAPPQPVYRPHYRQPAPVYYGPPRHHHYRHHHHAPYREYRRESYYRDSRW